MWHILVFILTLLFSAQNDAYANREYGPIGVSPVVSKNELGKPESVIYITKTGRWYSAKNISGLAEISVKLVSNGRVLEEVFAVSGRPGKQTFKLERFSVSGSKEPAPEMVYSIPEGPVVVPKTHHNYSPLGPWWIWIDFEKSSSKNPRKFLGIHTDFDRKLKGKGGTLGCIATHNVSDMKKIVSWFNGYFNVAAPKNVIVDWGKGSVSPPY